MNITHINRDGACFNNYDLRRLIEKHFENSRFSFNIIPIMNGLKLINVRIKSSKAYCGSHPNSCEVGGIETSRKARYLEGADWVEFNDELNNCLDNNNISANIKSSVCIVRKGTFRRTRYWSYRPHPYGNYQWNYDDPDYYTDGTGLTGIVSSFPEGTPGIYEKISYHEVG